MKYDLEDRTLNFAKSVRSLVSHLPRTLSNIEDGRQAIRSSGSIGANYREANEAISKKDFLFRVRIARKEAKETFYWLQLLDVPNSCCEERERLSSESKELTMILNAILNKSQ